ncbi:MAG: ABC transporter substrate-binding protein, partial [Bacillota bacterium]
MALVAMLFGAIAGLAAAPVTIKVMRPGYPKEARVFFTEVEQALVKEHPNIRLEIIDADWNTFHSRIPIWVSGRQEPDVYLCSPSDLAALVDIGAMMPLDSLVDTELKQDIPAGAWQDVKYKDKIYAIPAAVAPFVLWYNKDIFRQAGLDPAKPPTTWDELLSYSQQIKKNTGVAGLGIGLGRSLDFTQLVWGMLYYSATNANYVDGNGKSLITSADSIRAHQFLTD